MKGEYDFYFVMSPISIKYPPGGYKILYKLAAKLAERKYKIAIQFLTDPFRVTRTIFRDKSKIRNMGFLPYLMKDLMNNKFSFRYLIPNVRKMLGVNYCDNFENVDIFFSKNLPKDVTSERYIATDYVTAFFVAYEINSAMKYYISQLDEADQIYLGDLQWLAKEAYKLPLKLVVLNDDMMRIYAHKEPVLFHVGIDDYFFNSFTTIENSDDKRILFSLRIGEMKGASYGIEAARLIKENIGNIQISAFGNHPKNEVPSFIDYHYLPSNDEVIKLYRNSTIFVLPSILEGMPLPPLEAMASGCVVVSTDCIGIRVYLKDEFNSIIVPVREPNALFTAVQRLLSSKDLMEKLRMNGIITASRYSYDEMTDEFIGGLSDAYNPDDSV